MLEETMFSRREIAVMAMSIDGYIHRSDCPEPEGVRVELRECVRKLHALLDFTDDTPYPFPRIPEVEEWENQHGKKEQVNPLYSLPLEETDEIKEDSDLFK